MPKHRAPIVASAYVEEGPRVVWDDPKLSMAALKGWQGERITITIAQEEQKRSLRALRYLFGVIYKDAVIALREAGYGAMNKDRLHGVMKDRHLTEVVLDPFTGEERKIVRSTRDLTVGEMSEFMEWVMSELAELCGISFPPPRRDEEWREGKAA